MRLLFVCTRIGRHTRCSLLTGVQTCTLPIKEGRVGSVEHARVIHAAPDRQLRLSGALGPLQAEAVTGTQTFDIAPSGKGVRVVMRYVFGGYIRMGAARIAPVVDKVLAEQLSGLQRAAEEDADGRTGLDRKSTRRTSSHYCASRL